MLKGEIKTFTNMQIREFVAGRLTLQEILNEVFQAESKWPSQLFEVSHTYIHTKSNNNGKGNYKR